MITALEGIRILDLADASAVFASRLLADFGADVIRVEPPDGGRVRRTAPFLDDRPGIERSCYHLYHNANKRSVTLDIRTGAGAELLKQLAATADVLIHTELPSTAEALGLTHAALHAASPRLVSISVTPFGIDAPWRDRKVTDLVAAAAGGLLHVTGDPGDPPTRGGAEPAFKMASLVAATAALIAVTGRDADPAAEGAGIDVSIQESVVMSVLQTSNANIFRRQGIIPKRPGMHPSMYQCADGRWLSFRVRADGFEAFLDWVASRGLTTEFTSAGLTELQANGDVNRDARVMSLIQALALTQTRSAMLRRAWDLDMIALPVTSFPEMLELEHFVENRQFIDVGDDARGTVLRYPRSPADMMRGAEVRRAPKLGEHNRDVYGELGLSPERLRELSEQAVI